MFLLVWVVVGGCVVVSVFGVVVDSVVSIGDDNVVRGIEVIE